MGRDLPGPGEPLFLQADTEAVLAWQEYQDQLCPGCGLPRDETMRKEHQNHYEGGVLRCHACAARDRRAKEYTKGEHDDAGLFFIPREIDG